MYQEFNPSPTGARVGDCSVRAVAKALGTDWETAYAMLALKGFEMADMPNSNAVINAVLIDKGFEKDIIPKYLPCVLYRGAVCGRTPRGDIRSGNRHARCRCGGRSYQRQLGQFKRISYIFLEKEVKHNGLSVL